jgi:hypothetical protein
MPPLEQSAAGSRDGSSEGAEQIAVAWQIVGLVPHMAATLDSLIATAAICPLEARDSLADMCDWLGTAVYYIIRLRGSSSPASPERLQAWVAAVQASTRLLPPLAQLDAAWCQQPAMQNPELQNAALRLVTFLCLALWNVKPPLSHAPAEAGQLLQSLPEQLWQLHSSSCRVLHWLTGSQAGAALMSRLGAISSSVEPWLRAPDTFSGGWRHFLQGFNVLFLGVIGLAQSGAPPGGDLQPGRCVSPQMHACVGSRRASAHAADACMPQAALLGCPTGIADPNEPLPCNPLQSAPHAGDVCCALGGLAGGGARCFWQPGATRGPQQQWCSSGQLLGRP